MADTMTLKLSHRRRQPGQDLHRIWLRRRCTWSRGSPLQWQDSHTSRSPRSTAVASRGRCGGRSAAGNLELSLASSPRPPSGTQWAERLQHQDKCKILPLLFIRYTVHAIHNILLRQFKTSLIEG